MRASRSGRSTPAIDQVRALAGQMGGFVANTSIQAGNERLRSASIELRIPNDRFDAAVSGLNGLGKLETVQITTEDVGEQYTDIAARVTNAHRLEDRLIDVLAHRPGKLQDILAVERELARVREEIERYEGRLRYLKSRAATSRLTLSVHEPVPVIETDRPVAAGRCGAAGVGAVPWPGDPCDRLVWRRDSGGPDGGRRVVDAAAPAPRASAAGLAHTRRTT